MEFKIENAKQDLGAVNAAIAKYPTESRCDAKQALQRIARDIEAVISGEWKPTPERYSEYMARDNFIACCANADGGDLDEADND